MMKKINLKSEPAKIITFLIILGVFFAIFWAPLPGEITSNGKVISLTQDAKTVLAILAFAVLLWITEVISFPMTGLISMLMLVVTKVVPYKQVVLDSFGNPIILFFMGVLIFSAALSETILLRRLTALMLFRFGDKPKIIILIFLTTGMLLAGWVVEMAVAAILLPIGVSILKDANIKPLESNFGRVLMIACAWGPATGGITTPVGSGTNPLTIGFMHDLVGVDFSFLNWMTIGYPAAILMLPMAWFILIKIFPLEPLNLKISENEFHKRVGEIGPVHWREIALFVILGFTMFLWITAPWIEKWSGGKITYLSISFIAVFCASLLFLPGIRVMNWKKAEGLIAWGGIILIVTGLALGMALYKTGGAEWLAWMIFRKIGLLGPAGKIFAIVLGVSIIKVLFSSNTVTGIIMVPLVIALAKTMDIDPVLLAIPAGITASLAFILVTSTPTNVIPYSAGYFSIKDMAKAGIWMTIASSVCVTLSILIMGKLTGLVNW